MASGHGQALPIHPGCNYADQNWLFPEGRMALLFLVYFFLKEMKKYKNKKVLLLLSFKALWHLQIWVLES